MAGQPRAVTLGFLFVTGGFTGERKLLLHIAKAEPLLTLPLQVTLAYLNIANNHLGVAFTTSCMVLPPLKSISSNL